MKRFLIAVLVLATTCFNSSAQDSKKKINFQSSNTLGIAAGEHYSKPIIATVNGVKFQTVFIGAGIGWDYYFHRSVPVYLEVRKAVFKKPNTPFLYADAGYHWIWEQKKSRLTGDFEGDFYYDLGVGYDFPVLKDKILFISIGYSRKDYTYVAAEYDRWDDTFLGPAVYTDVKNELERVMIKAGLRL